VVVNSEDPEFLYEGDVKDVTAEVARAPMGNRRVLVPRTDHVEVAFGINAGGTLGDVRSLLESVAAAITGRLFESAKLLTTELSGHTGLQISCCQTGIAGVPRGMTEDSFGAGKLPARQLLQRLALAEGTYQRRMRRDPSGVF
jgi:hypothetical protein